MSIPVRRMVGSCLITLVAVLLWTQWALGVQDTEAAANQSANRSPSEPSADTSQGKTYRERMASWKKLIAEMRVLREKYAVAGETRREELIKQYDDLRRQGRIMAPLLEQAAVREYRAAPNEDVRLAEFLLVLVNDKISDQQFEAGDRLATTLIEGGVDQLKSEDFDARNIFWMAGWAKYVLGDWRTAASYLEKAQAARLLGAAKHLRRAYRLVSDETELKKFEADWRQEKKLRAAEAKADDLPRVVLKTMQGDIVLELFENEAPNTVANFISLVEKKFYDGLTFHRVELNVMAQGGDPRGDGKGGPGYRIKCECYEKNHRKHFRGSISMAHVGEPDTGGSQFFMCFVPTPQLNGQHTVFGRVIEGIENMSRLRRGDEIVVARVIRKRDHEYEPSTL